MDTRLSENSCGDGVAEKNCTCAKYRFRCTPGDGACTPEEQSLKTMKWAYMITSDQMCKEMKKVPIAYQQVKCCKKNKCNVPSSKKTKCMDMMSMFNSMNKQKN